MPSTCQKILLIRVDRIGDLILSTPFFQNLLDVFPGAETTLLGRSFARELLPAHAAIRRFVSVDGPDGRHAIRSLAAEHFDLVIDMHRDYILHTALLAKRMQASCRVGFDMEGRGALFDIPVLAPGGKHFIEETLDILRTLGYTPKRHSPAVSLTANNLEHAKLLLREQHIVPPYVVLHPGGFYSTQRWPALNFAHLAEDIYHRDLTPVFIGAAQDDEAFKQIVAAMGTRARIICGCSVGDSAAVIAGASLFVGNNSGPLHIACAAGVPSVSTMGPTDPVRFWPVSEHAVVLRATNVTEITLDEMLIAVSRSLSGLSLNA